MFHPYAAVTAEVIRAAVRDVALAGRAICVHSSLRSFGRVEGGAEAVVQAFLDEGCTMLVPTFTDLSVPPPPEMRLERNGWNYTEYMPWFTAGVGRVYSRDSVEIQR